MIFEHRIGFGRRAHLGQKRLEDDDRRGVCLDLSRYLDWNRQIAGPHE